MDGSKCDNENFNSIKVRLELVSNSDKYQNTCDFNSIKVRLEPKTSANIRIKGGVI